MTNRIEIRIRRLLRGEKSVLENGVLQSDRPEIIGIMGRNASGKSTLLAAIGTQLKFEGQLRLFGRSVSDLSKGQLTHLRKRIGQQLQNFNLPGDLRVGEVLRFAAAIRSGSDSGPALDNILNLLELSERQNDCVANLNGASRARLAIATALIHLPKNSIVLLDEPIAAADPHTEQTIANVIREQRETMGHTIIVVAHQYAWMGQICDRLMIIKDRRLGELRKPGRSSSAARSSAFPEPSVPSSESIIETPLSSIPVFRR